MSGQMMYVLARLARLCLAISLARLCVGQIMYVVAKLCLAR